MPSIKIFFALAALVAVSAAQPTAPVGDSWVYAIQNNDLDFNGKNDDTGEKYQCECNAFYEKNPKIAAMEKVDGKRVWRTCDTTQLTTTLYMNYGRAGMIKLGPYGNFTGGISPGGEDFSVPTYGKCLGDNNNDASACGDKAPTELEMKNLQAVGACQTMLTATLTIPYYPKGTDPSTFLSADQLHSIVNPCECWGALTEADAEADMYCKLDGGDGDLKYEWDICQDQIKLKDWNLVTDGFKCEEASIDSFNATYSINWKTDAWTDYDFWGGVIAGVYPRGGTAEDCAAKCFKNPKCGAFQFNIDHVYGPVDTHEKGGCLLFPKKLNLANGTEVDVEAPKNQKIGTARFCVKDGTPRAAATPTCESLTKQLDLYALLDQKPLTPPLTKNVARKLIQKLKVQFKALKADYRAAKENLRNKGRAAGDGV